MQTRPLKNANTRLPALGLGCMGMSDFYGNANQEESLATINQAIEADMTLLDTGDFYGMGRNELLIREVLKIWPRDKVFIAVKFGALRDPSGQFAGFDGSPAAVRNFLAHTLTRLGTDYVDLYQPARVDPAVPIEDTVGAINDMREAGYVRHIGLSEAGPDTIRRAHAETPISWLQIEYSLLSRGIEQAILPTCRERDIAISAYGVLSRGLLSGHWQPRGNSDARDFRSHLPRFQGANLDNNLRLVEALRDIADDRDCSVAQLAIAWVLAQGNDILPLIGARTRERLDESLGALGIELSASELARIEDAVPASAVAGERYDPEQMKMLDSER